MRKKYPGLPLGPDLVHVPTLPELAEQGLAEIVEVGKRGTFYRATPAGQATIYAAMRKNAATWKEWLG